jgi:hypothetical protein
LFLKGRNKMGRPKRKSGSASAQTAGKEYPTVPSSGRKYGGFDIIAALGAQKYPSVPTPDIASMYSGRKVATDIGGDRVMSSRPTLINIANNGTNWINTVTPFRHLQCGNANPTNPDPNAEAMFGSFATSLYGDLVRVLESRTGRLFSIRDSILDNTGAGNDSFSWFMNLYSNAYIGLRGLEGLLNAGNFSNVMSLASNAVNTQLMRLQADLDRLLTIPMAPSYCKMMDRLCGPKAFSEDGCVFIQTWGNGGAVLDVTITGNIANYLSAVETVLSQMLGPSYPASMGNDFQRIINVLALAYGTKAPFGPKKISLDPLDLSLLLSQGISYRDTTAVKIMSEPTTTVYGVSAVPVFIHRSVDLSNPDVAQMFSYWRPQVINRDPAPPTGIAPGFYGWTGLFGNELGTNTATNYAWYTQIGTETLVEFAGAGPQTSVEVANLSPINSIFPFGEQAGAELVNAAGEARAFDDWYIFYVPDQWILEETVYSGQRWFLGDITG